MQSPCLDCCQRQQGCHDICDSYQEYRRIRESISKKMINESNYKDYVGDAMLRMGVGRRGFR